MQGKKPTQPKDYDDSFMDNFSIQTSGQENLSAKGGAHNAHSHTQPTSTYTPVPVVYNPQGAMFNGKPIPPLDRSNMQRRRGGRVPRLMRFEVDLIRADSRNVTDAAKHYGVSENTIRRVREIGCFAGVPYIPADEYDNTVTTHGNAQTPMSGFAQPSASVPKFGRPYAKRSKPFTDTELRDIASTPNVRELAELYNVSRSTIHNIKKKMRSTLPQGQSLIDVALTDPRPSSELARQYGIVSGWFDHVRQYGEPPQPRDPAMRGTEAKDFRRGAVTMQGYEADSDDN